MIRTQNASPEMLSLLSALCDDPADQENLYRLEKSVGQDPDGIGLIFDYLQLHSDLRFEFIGRKASAPMLHDIGGASTQRPDVQDESGQRPALAPTVFSARLHGTIGYFPEGMPLAYLIATLVTGLGLLIGSLVPVVGPDEVARQSACVPSPLSSLPSVVGRITGVVDCKWADPKTQGPRPKTLVTFGDQFALSAGLMEITYNTGPKVILQGPVTYEVEANGGYLAVGKLTGKLEKGSGFGVQGSESSNLQISKFIIHTPTATVTDLGTEFGVEVSGEGVTDAQVFSGTVKVVPSGSESGRIKEQILHAGSALRVDGGGNQSTTVQPNARRFVRALPLSTRAARADAYAEMVLSMNPFAYYRMELPNDSQETTTVLDSAPGGHHGTLRLRNEPGGGAATMGRFGTALQLGGPDLGGYADVKDFPTTDTNQLSVSAWVYAWNRDFYAQIVDEANWRDRGSDWQFSFSLYQSDGDLTAGVVARNGIEARVREGAEKQLPVGRWQHVAFVADGSVLHLYRNGVEVAAAPCDGVRTLPPIKHLTIGCHNGVGPNDPPEAIKPVCFWCGRIDEVAIFYHALSAGQVRQLFAGPARTLIPQPSQEGSK